MEWDFTTFKTLDCLVRCASLWVGLGLCLPSFRLLRAPLWPRLLLRWRNHGSTLPAQSQNNLWPAVAAPYSRWRETTVGSSKMRNWSAEEQTKVRLIPPGPWITPEPKNRQNEGRAIPSHPRESPVHPWSSTYILWWYFIRNRVPSVYALILWLSKMKRAVLFHNKVITLS